MHPYPRFALSQKQIALFPGWSAAEAETGYSWFDASLEINGVVEAGIVLHGGCYRHRPDCNVTLEIRVGRQPGRPCVPLARVCWRSLKGGHTVQRRWNTEWAGQPVPETHYHEFALNWREDRQRMKGDNLPVARPIETPLENYEALRSYAGKVLRISNIDVVGPPPWGYDLFAGGLGR